MRVREIILLSMIGTLWACGRVGYQQQTSGDDGGAITDDGGTEIHDGMVANSDGPVSPVDGGLDGDAMLDPIGMCADWSNWVCAGGGGQCYATCTGYTADCYPDGCVCETSMGTIQCATPPGDCNACEALMLEGCCGPLN